MILVFMFNRLTTQQIISNGLIAGLYIILTITPPLNQISYLAIQFRISEVLLLLIFFRKDYVIGIVIGTFFANFFGPNGGWNLIDAILGSIVSGGVGYLMGKSKSIGIAIIYPIIFNGIYVGLLLPFILDVPFNFFTVGGFALSVALGEAAVLIILGLPLFYGLRKNRYFLVLIGATQNVR
jgi:uncharacterized membrane protein